jgi:outer membrane protein OmpA-like peptidoglycan-associated protein
MLHQPRRWLPGLLPLALLAGGSLWWKQDAIETDLSARATRAIGAASTVDGKAWASVTVRGRDAVITGTAPGLDAAVVAETSAEGQSGIRRADAANDLLPAANPFGWSARRDGQTITLSGQVAPDGSRARLVAAAQKAVPGGAVSDLMTLARDIPATATRAAEMGIEQLGRVASGSATLTGTAFRFTGTAADAATKALIDQALAALPQGIAAGGVNVSTPGPAPAQTPPPAAILPPVADWSATKAADGAIRLTGTIGSEEARQRIVAAARASTTGPVTDAMTVIGGLPANLEAKALSAIEQLKGLASGAARIAGTAFSFSGVAADHAAFERLAASVRAASDGFSIGDLVVAPPVVAPFSWSARRTPQGLTLQGFAPSEAAKAAALAQAARLFPGLRVVDETRVASGFPSGVDFAALSTTALTQLARLAEGSVQMTGNRLSLAGRAADAAVAVEIRRALAAIGSPVLAVSDIAVPPAVIPPPPPLPPLAADLVAPAVPPPSPAPRPAAPLTVASAPIVTAPPPPLPPGAIPPPPAAPALSADLTPPPPAPVAQAAPPAATAPPRPPGTMPPPPAPAPVTLPRPDCSVIIQTALEGDRILFDYWKAEQRAEHGPVLDRLAAAIRRCASDERIEVAGHADLHNATNQNQKLSEDRAGLMRAELIRRGVSASSLVVVGYAASRPVVDGDTEEARALNRRVEFHVLPRN